MAAGDVVGKGMPAALLMSSLSSEVRHYVRTEPDPARVVEQLNRHFFEAEILDRFITFLLVIVDAEAHQITVVNAGHLPPFLRRASRARSRSSARRKPDPPLGVVPDHAYRVDHDRSRARRRRRDVHRRRQRGDRRPGTDLFGVAGHPPDPRRRPTRTIPEVGEAILKAVRVHAAGRPQSDDIALVCFGLTA